MKDKNKNIIKFIIRISVTITLLTWVFSQIDTSQLGQTIKTAKWQFLIAIWAVTLIIFFLDAVRMRYILKKQNCGVKITAIFEASAITSFYSLIVPGLLSTAAKWYVLKKHTGKGIHVFSGMVYNQLSTIIVLMFFGLTALIISNPTSLIFNNTKNVYLLPLICAILLLFLILTTLLLLNNRTGGKIIKILNSTLKLFPQKLRSKGSEILQQIAVFQNVGWKFHLIAIFFIGLGHTVCSVATYILAAKAARIEIPTITFIWLWAFIYILGRIPISIANLGVREVTLISLLAIYGVEKADALLMSMVLFSAIIFMAIIGAVYQLRWAVSARKSA